MSIDLVNVPLPFCSYDGTQDKRCPTLNGAVNTWKWNDYRPVLGENVWAQMIAPLQLVGAFSFNDVAAYTRIGLPQSRKECEQYPR